MNIKILTILIAVFAITGCAITNQAEQVSSQNMQNQQRQNKLIIAHRGASGYLPEHSLAAKAMAHAMDVDYIEQDVVMTKDDHLVVLHDPYLDRVTDVMEVFPNRSREVFGQQRWLAIDFTLKEIKQLKMTEGFTVDPENKNKIAGYPNRFPLFKSSFQVATLQEEIELIQGLNYSTGKNIGIYVEIKSPWFHHLEGKDISKLTLQIIRQYGYKNKSDKAYVQCFDPDETQRIHDKLMPELGMDLKLVQLIAETSWNETMRFKDGELVPYNYDWMFKSDAMPKIAKYADAIGPWKAMLVSAKSTMNNLIINNMVKNAHAQGMKVHPYTFRKEDSRIPVYAKSFENLLDVFLYQIGVDGLFTDFPDLAVKFVKNNRPD